MRRERARKDVGGATGGNRHDDAHGAVGITLRCPNAGCARKTKDHAKAMK